MPEAKKNISEEFNGETLDTVDVGSVDVSEQMTFVNEIYDTYPVSTAGTPSFSKPFGSAKVNTNEGTVNAGETEDLEGEYADIIEDNTQEQSLPEETEQDRGASGQSVYQRHGESGVSLSKSRRS